MDAFSYTVRKSVKGEFSDWIIDIHHNGENVAYASIYDLNDHVFLKAIYVKKPFRKMGLATKLMKIVINNFQTTIKLKAEPYDDKPLSLKELIEFYQKFGFQENELGYMIREPKEVLK